MSIQVSVSRVGSSDCAVFNMDSLGTVQPLRLIGFNVRPWIFYPKNFSNIDDLRGPLANMMREILKSLNIKYKLLYHEEEMFGTRQSDGNWTGILGTLQKNEADMAMLPVMVSYQRTLSFTYLKAFFRTSWTMLGGSPDSQGTNIKGLVMVFDWEVWLGVFLGLAILVFLSSVKLERYTNGEPFFAIQGGQTYGAVSQYVAALLNEASAKEPGSSFQRFLFGVWWIAVIVISNSFTGHFRASMMIAPPAAKVNSLEELSAAGEKVHAWIWKGTAIEDYFRHSSNADVNKIWKIVEKSNRLTSLRNLFSIERLLKLGSGKLILIGESTTMKFSIGRSCSIVPRIAKMNLYFSKDDIITQQGASVLRKEISHLHIFRKYNIRLQWLLQSGIIDFWLNKEFRSFDKCLYNPSEQKEKPLGMEDIGSIFGVLFVMLSFCLLVFVFEHVLAKTRTPIKPKLNY